MSIASVVILQVCDYHLYTTCNLIAYIEICS